MVFKVTDNGSVRHANGGSVKRSVFDCLKKKTEFNLLSRFHIAQELRKICYSVSFKNSSNNARFSGPSKKKSFNMLYSKYSSVSIKAFSLVSMSRTMLLIWSKSKFTFKCSWSRGAPTQMTLLEIHWLTISDLFKLMKMNSLHFTLAPSVRNCLKQCHVGQKVLDFATRFELPEANNKH